MRQKLQALIYDAVEMKLSIVISLDLVSGYANGYWNKTIPWSIWQVMVTIFVACFSPKIWLIV